MEIGGFDPLEFRDWQEPAASDEEEEGTDDEGGGVEDSREESETDKGWHNDGADNSGDGKTAGEAEQGGDAQPRVVLPSYMSGHT